MQRDIWPRENEKLRPSLSHSHVFYLVSALLLENTCQRPSRWAGHWDHVSSHGNGGSAHCSRKVMHFSRFILLLYRSRALA